MTEEVGVDGTCGLSKGSGTWFCNIFARVLGYFRLRNPDAHSLTVVALCHQGRAIRTEFGLAPSAPNDDTEPSASALGPPQGSGTWQILRVPPALPGDTYFPPVFGRG